MTIGSHLFNITIPMNNINRYIDHTILKPTTDKKAIYQLCDEAAAYNFAAVCVPPYYVALAKKLLAHSSVKVATVISFSLGFDTTETKFNAIEDALNNGADEIDLVQNICAVKNKEWEYLHNEITECLQPVRLNNKRIKVILETGELTTEEIIQCCDIYSKHKVDFVKTSTGFSSNGGANLEVVKLMRLHLPQNIAIKASGGIKTFDDAKAYILAGATRIGTSSGIAICKGNE